MPQVKISGGYTVPKGTPQMADALHSFEERTKDGFGGKMHTIVTKALKDFYKTYKVNPTITSINILMDGNNWTVKWEVLIGESTDGIAWIGLTSRGGAGPKDGSSGSISRAKKQANDKIKALPSEVNPKTISKELYDFRYQFPNGSTYIRQIFILYNNPSSNPNLISTSPTKTEGVIINAETNEPVKGAKVETESPIITEPAPIIQSTPQIDISLGDEEGYIPPPEPIQVIEPPSTDIPTPIIPPTSNTEGDFTLEIPPQKEIITPNTESLSTLNTKPTAIIISAPGYEPVEVIPYKGDGTPKDNLGIIQIQPKTKSIEEDKISASQLTEAQIEAQSTDQKDFKYYSQKKLNDSIINIKTKLIPVILTLISEIGVVGVQKLIEQGKNKIPNLKDQITCPTQAELIQLINRKNKLVKQLNNTLKIIDSTTKALGITGGIIETLNIAFQVIKNLPLPSAVPPGVGLPINVILGIQDNKDKLDYKRFKRSKCRSINNSYIIKTSIISSIAIS